MHLAWDDEFSGSTLDSAKWTALNNSTFGDGNNELACLMQNNVHVSGGVLTIAAQRAAAPVTCGSNDTRFPNGRSYTSGFIQTYDKATFEYGRFEIRAELPTIPGQSAGLWPAFWLRPESGGLGELDSFEVSGSDATSPASANTIGETIHYDYIGTHPQQREDYVGSGLSSAFHTYAVDWEPGSIKWYVDGKLTYERNRTTTPWIDQAFSGKFYLRLNLAVGGNGVGAPTSTTVLPGNLRVDWVRVYQH
jgi:beta-glucanase (GH16 family)